MPTMSATAHDPHLLYSIKNITAFHIQNGEQSELTPSGPQTLSLLMVPTSAPAPQSSHDAPAEEDFYLHLHLPPELDIALPASTQIYHQPPNSYLIPRWDLGPDAGAFIRIQFPTIGSGPDKVTQEDVDTFETILAQCTAFLERATPPKEHTPYNPADFAPGEGYVSSSSPDRKDPHGRIVLVDEEDGSVVGEMEGYDVVEKPGVKPGSKRPVEVELPTEGEGNKVRISNVSEEYLQMARHPAYKDSTLVQTSATASRLIVTGSSYFANMMMSGAETFTKKTKPNPKPMTFSETTHSRVRKVGTITNGAAGLSAKTVGQVGKYAQNIGASLSRRNQDGRRRGDKALNGGYKPGVLNKSMIAFSTLADGVEQGARAVLTSSSVAASTMIGHRYGAEAGAVASDLTGGIKNVGLVYIDASGVSRKAVLKSVAKGMVVGRMRDGKQVLVGSGDGGDIPPGAGGQSNGTLASGGRRPSPTPTPPPAYSARNTTSPGGTSTSRGKR
ncbi:senescence-associated protein-domain-containing protein [Aspergillus coremiiformis]|uniref:Senescence-associated protein-domain-containing protein n=1 Tax=Aspergillus coremiiformis TaxID=138285 RepID=A0A5N6YRM6_9EURO|nr:senescence-associated protein-domain-containing protein [Aspergillus coremiiformis]